MMWKDIPGYEGRYQVSDTGQVRTVERTVVYPPDPCRPQGSVRVVPSRLLVPDTYSRGGYLRVYLIRRQGTRGRRHMVHRLVWEAFGGPRCEAVHHKDNNPRNNNIANLLGGTYVANVEAAIRDGHRNPYHRRQLTDKQAVLARMALFVGARNTHVARHFGVSKEVIMNVKSYRAYRASDDIVLGLEGAPCLF